MKKQEMVIFLWYDDQAEQAVNFYLSVFEDSEVERINHYGAILKNDK